MDINYNRDWKRQHRLKINSRFGGKCQICGSVKNLHLHHIFYAVDSCRKGGNDSKRIREALEHPERFQLICRSCHSKITYKEGKGLGNFIR